MSTIGHEQNNNLRSDWIDNIRAIATIAVVLIHTSAPAVATLYDPQAISNTAWQTANVYDSFARFAVPIFVMITGTLLLPQTISLNDFLKKRLNRILLPFIFWSILYIMFNLALKIRDEGFSNALADILPWLTGQVIHGPAVHLWYIHMIIGLYLFIPVIKPWVQAAGNKEILFFLGLWLVTLFFRQQTFIDIKMPLGLDYFSGYVGYLLLGYYISERIVLPAKARYFAALLFIAAVLVTIVGTTASTQLQGRFSDSFYDFLSLNVCISATALFIFFKSLKSAVKRSVLVETRNILSKYGFGIYLCHMLILSIMSYFKVDFKLADPLISIPLVTVICLAISCCIIYLMGKLPYGKYVSG